jgi:hypothetical protein
MPDSSTLQVFISYSRTDSAFVNRLKADLKHHSISAWVDHSNIEGGQEWPAELQRAIDQSQVMLVVLSEEAVKSSWLANEYHYGLRVGKRVIPILLQPCQVPLALITKHWLDFQASYDNGLGNLLKVLNAVQDLKDQQPNETVTPSTTRPSSTTLPAPLISPLQFNLNSLIGKRSCSIRVVLATLALLLILASIGIGASYYQITSNTSNASATATAQARNTSIPAALTATAQARNTSIPAALTATVTEAYSLYAQATAGVPFIKAALSSSVPGPWARDVEKDASCTFTTQDYHIAVQKQGFKICFAPDTTLTDFTFQVQMTIIKGERGGIVFRITPSQNSVDAYYFEINSNGRYSLFRVQSNTANVLAADTSPLIKTGLDQPNMLTAIVRGSSIIIFINRQYVASVTDPTYKSGLIGLIAQTDQQATEVAFSDAEVWTVQ